MAIRDTPPDSITFHSPTNQHIDLKEFIDIMRRGGCRLLPIFSTSPVFMLTPSSLTSQLLLKRMKVYLASQILELHLLAHSLTKCRTV
uniref:Uncharacterized protein n=1 Tax=Lepeophtheirus salmonis TaxID=72036 RepID=A0A0K2U1P6_LEPSM